MSLSTEDRQRIEEEERKRVAEEQYRSQVRATLNAPSSNDDLPWWRRALGLTLIIGATACLTLIIAALVLSNIRAKSSDEGAGSTSGLRIGYHSQNASDPRYAEDCYGADRSEIERLHSVSNNDRGGYGRSNRQWSVYGLRWERQRRPRGPCG